MLGSLEDWISFLRDSSSASGIPLIIAGTALALFGWRLWKFCVVLCFGLIGAGVATCFVHEAPDRWLVAFVSGAALAAISSWPINYSVSFLGGIIGGAIGYFYLEFLQADPIIQWAGAGVIGLACTGMAVINKRKVVILVTAFLGAILIISGLTAWIVSSPELFGTFRSMSSTCAIVVPFVLLVPTVMSCFYQMAEVRRLQIEL
ncbi:MAG: hypothetical protein HY287_05570 [Planctomycetes bacterium]|nr:hypothetical protein [Planctomycetota bacterium]MBI3833780.1 hypothetical protein [Planctomycetota bacterium]